MWLNTLKWCGGEHTPYTQRITDQEETQTRPQGSQASAVQEKWEGCMRKSIQHKNVCQIKNMDQSTVATSWEIKEHLKEPFTLDTSFSLIRTAVPHFDLPNRALKHLQGYCIFFDFFKLSLDLNLTDSFFLSAASEQD